mmetsp:Transcript_80646/g.226870  ORF Transcript_80646/g.226870 Transcript_80646/m.226870 type:complete len:170 (-) Transcript_80646:55-564(-)
MAGRGRRGSVVACGVMSLLVAAFLSCGRHAASPFVAAPRATAGVVHMAPSTAEVTPVGSEAQLQTAAVAMSAHKDSRMASAIVAAAAVLAAVPLAAHADPEDIEPAIKPWLNISPFYGLVLYVIGIAVQKFKIEEFNKVYLASAVMWLGPPFVFILSFEWLGFEWPFPN